MLFGGVLLVGCTSSKSNYSREYEKVWKEMIKSQAWKNSLEEGIASTPRENRELLYSSADAGMDDQVILAPAESEMEFDTKFHSLVSRAYYKIISEAEAADKRLKEEHARLSAMQRELNASQSKMYEQNLELINRRYQAHTEMLEGLKSWKIFSEYRSGDLDYFKADNKEAVLAMHQKGKSDESIINFLVFKLADLYHFEE